MKPLFIFLGGAAVGAIAALLLAPETGEETRAKVKAYLKNKGLISEDGTEAQATEGGDFDSLIERITAEINEE